MKSKILKIDGREGFVSRPSGETEMEFFKGICVTPNGVVQISQDSDNNQFLRVMLCKNCVLHVLTSRLNSPENYQPFVGSLMLIFREEDKHKLEVLIMERSEDGIIDSCVFKLQHHDYEKLLFLTRKLMELWITESGSKLIHQRQILQLGVDE